MSVPPADGTAFPAADDLTAAARHLGQAIVPDPLLPAADRVADRLALSAIVLGAAERQMLNTEARHP